MRLTLTLFDPSALAGGPTTRRRFEQPCVTIGRAADNDWALTDPRAHLSEHHCRIERHDGGFRLIDTSTSGVFLNESPTALGMGNAAPLAPGDRIALGDYLIAVEREEAGRDDGGRDDGERASASRETVADTGFDTPPPRAQPEDRLPVSGAIVRERITADAAPRAPRARSARAGGRRGARDDGAETVAAFLDGAGLATLDLPRERALALLRAGGAALREAVVGAQDVLRMRLRLARGAPLDRAQLRASGDNPLTGAADADESLRLLLGVERPPRVPPDQAVRELIAEIAQPGPVAGTFERAGSRRIAWAALGALAGVIVGAGASWLALERATPEPTVASAPPPAVPPAASPPAPPPPPASPAAAPAPVAAPVPTPVIAPVIAPPTIDRRQLRGELAQLFRGFVCADLSAEIDDDGTVTVAGFVSRGDELPRLHREVSALRQVARVDSRATVEPWPFCEVRNLLRTQTAGGPAAPSIEPSHADRVYREGEALIVTATLDATTDSHLYVDFFDTDGRVVHMLPTSLRPDNRVGAKARIALGATPDKAGRNERVYIISPPFGTGMVIALSSQRPLFSELRPETEDARSYLAALAGALVRDPVGAGSAARITSGQQSIMLVAR